MLSPTCWNCGARLNGPTCQMCGARQSTEAEQSTAAESEERQAPSIFRSPVPSSPPEYVPGGRPETAWPDRDGQQRGSQWDEDTTDDAWTGALPRQQIGRPWVARPVIMVVLVVVILAVLATVSYGYVGLNWFRPNRPASVAQAPAATATQAHQPSATTGPAPSPTLTTAQTVTPNPQPTATPTNSSSKPTATPTPAGPPPQLWVHQVVFAPKYCAQVAGGWSCADTLGNTGSSPLPWTASSTMSGASFTPSSGTLAPGEQTQVTFILPCVHSGTIYFTGPANQVAVSWGCYANG